MSVAKSRWRFLGKRTPVPPAGRQLLLFAPELRGKRGMLDDGVRLGYWDGRMFRQAEPKAEEKGTKFLRWWPYPAAPRVERQPSLELTPDMRMAVDRLRAAFERGKLKRLQPIDVERYRLKQGTLNALLRRGIIKRGGGSYYLP